MAHSIQYHGESLNLRQLYKRLRVAPSVLNRMRAAGRLNERVLDAYVTHRAERQRLRDLALASGVSPAMMRAREYMGWDSVRAATEPAYPNGGDRRTQRQTFAPG
jgi:hypothetical protein